MTDKAVKQQKRLLEQVHLLPYTIDVEEESFQIKIYTKLGKISGISVLDKEGSLSERSKAEQAVAKLQRYNFYFEYLTKRSNVVKERDSIIAERIEQTQLILNNNQLFGSKMQPIVDNLSLALEVYKQQQHKMDIYQEDIALLNEKIKEQGSIQPEDWHSAEDLSIAFMSAAYAQTIYLEATRTNRQLLAKWFHEHQKRIPSNERKALGKLISLLSDTNAGLVFDQIISLLPLLENDLLIDRDDELPKRSQEFNKEYAAHCRFYKPNVEKMAKFIRN
ncbi:hypothetical protein MFLO_03665 [Listeria floridensis FSL S10-1187]|uniref:Uncharacterized protein n=1 Tax=Listeria floridensis FSL S10-1187 TaxID=1265817 RepID=A0ABN0RHJ0_9LIST|nr:hypothetical protein [Listeria floridensis]EUJ33397.1 hypothetical protein MFLO_03665 [Listeria floridensis FSL S10-1187]